MKVKFPIREGCVFCALIVIPVFQFGCSTSRSNYSTINELHAESIKILQQISSSVVCIERRCSPYGSISISKELWALEFLTIYGKDNDIPIISTWLYSEDADIAQAASNSIKRIQSRNAVNAEEFLPDSGNGEDNYGR